MARSHVVVLISERALALMPNPDFASALRGLGFPQYVAVVRAGQEQEFSYAELAERYSPGGSVLVGTSIDQVVQALLRAAREKTVVYVCAVEEANPDQLKTKHLIQNIDRKMPGRDWHEVFTLLRQLLGQS